MNFGKSNLNGSSFFLLTVIFAISVLVRFPSINRPLSKHHEFVTAISLRVLQIWNAEGGAKYNFVPVMNYGGEANKHINNHASPTEGMVDAEGNYYYVSHPPLAYIIPHFYFKAIHVKPTVLSLQIFHLIINFLSGICIFLIVLSLKGIRARSQIDSTALIAFILYTFSSVVLWFQCNTYMSDMLVHFFFLIGILLVLKCLNYPSSSKWKILFALAIFLMIYTSWLGVIFAFVIFIFGISIWKSKNGINLAAFTGIASILALGLIYFQYSSINGSEAFIEHLTQRFHVRGSGNSGSEGGFVALKLNEIATVLVNYVMNYLPILTMVVILLLISWKKSLLKLIELKPFILISLLPVILLHLFLLKYSGHDFTVLYASCFLSIIAAFIIEEQNKVIRSFAIWLVFLASVGIYYYTNKPGDYSYKGDRYDTSMKLGQAIKKEAKANEVVYFFGNELDPMVVVYAERNIVFVRKRKGKTHVEINAVPSSVVFESVGKKLDVTRYLWVF